VRSLIEVIDLMIGQIPNIYEQREPMIAALKNIKTSYSYAPPEMQSFWWGEAAKTLTIFLGTPDTKWKINIQLIFSGTIDLKEFELNREVLEDE